MSVGPVPSINPIALPNPVNPTTNEPSSGKSVSGSFGQILSQAVDNLSQLQSHADTAITRLASGEDVDLHAVMIAMNKADIAFQVAMQVRNKLVEAYQEVMRIQV